MISSRFNKSAECL